MMLKNAPRPAAAFALGGLLPFVAGTLAVWLLPPGWREFALFAEMAYGAVLLSFLGAVHWGLAMGKAGTMGAGAMPPARLAAATAPLPVAWLALILQPLFGILALAAAFTALFLLDVRAVRRGEAPGWYRALRKPMTLVTLACLGLSLLRFLTL